MEKANDLLKRGEELYQSGNFIESIKYFAHIAQQDSKNTAAFRNWGLALFGLSKNIQNKPLFLELCKNFIKAVKSAPNSTEDFFLWGKVIYDFYKINQDESLFKEALICLIKSRKDILEILVSIYDKKDKKRITQTETLYSLLELDTDEGRFFRESTKMIKDKREKDKYKKIYIRSISIISLLHINNENEKLVATYHEKTISQKMLLKDTKFRLNAINYSNDPTEGKILFDYLFDKEKRPINESLNREYGEFAGCFIFNPDSLNQFRLYGKEDGKEGTGLSLVFKNSFFNEKAEMPAKQPVDKETDICHEGEKAIIMQQQLNEGSDNIKKKEIKHALFRCIYVDPETRLVENIGNRENHLFYRDEKKSEKYNDIKEKIKKYREYINETFISVRNEMTDLQELVKDLDSEVVGQLLLNLRYLIKHIAFKEEQECRIVKIYRLKNNTKIISSDDFKQMYIEYDPKVSDHVEKVIFGPKADGMELFRDMLTHKGILTILCEKSQNPLA